MSKREKTLELIFKNPISTKVSFRDAVSLLSSLGFEISSGDGSRYKAVYKEKGIVLIIHSHNPGDYLKPYLVREIRLALKELGVESKWR